MIFPLHPRTRERLKPMGDAHRLLAAGVLCGPPLGYLDFLSLQSGAGAVVTDSGTVQEETSALGVRCYTLRGLDRARDHAHARHQRAARATTRATSPTCGWPPGPPTPSAIPLWDGRAAARVADALVANYALVRAAGG